MRGENTGRRGILPEKCQCRKEKRKMEELARLLGLEPGFTLQHIEEAGMDFHLIFSRKADRSEQLPHREERKGLFE
jgi:hypothetical protein